MIIGLDYDLNELHEMKDRVGQSTRERFLIRELPLRIRRVLEAAISADSTVDREKFRKAIDLCTNVPMEVLRDFTQSRTPSTEPVAVPPDHTPNQVAFAYETAQPADVSLSSAQDMETICAFTEQVLGDCNDGGGLWLDIDGVDLGLLGPVYNS